MQPDASPIPHTLAQWFGFALATILAAVGGWFARRNREPVELDKLKAETRSIHVSSEVASVGVSLETLREIQSVIQKAEDRRAEWHAKEEQMRGQIIHWRCKAEELDGTVIDLREQNAQHETRARLHEHQIKKLKALLSYHNISYSELDHPKQ